MSDTKEPGDKILSVGGRKTLGLRRNVGSGTVRQNFSHGRSKAVVVEKKKRRMIHARGEQAKPETTAKAPEPAAQPEKEEKPAAAAPADANSRMVLRTLTDEEKGARAHALAEARQREVEDRKQAEVDAVRRAEEDERLRKEQEEADQRRAEEEARIKAEEESRVKAEEEARSRLGTPEPKRLAEAPAEETRKRRPPEPKVARRGEARRRGKLTIANALDDEERSRSLASVRRRREREKRQAAQRDPNEKVVREVIIPETITIQELANRMAVRSVDVIKYLMQQGQMMKLNDIIDADTAHLIAEEMGHSVKRVSEADVEAGLFADDDSDAEMAPRPPIVTIMGHVDHGKTSLLDAIRQTNVVSGEAGGITQHIGAYQVSTEGGDRITFIDTPGHAAFTAMRARGAEVTDIVVLVVSADDGVMPQTAEAIEHSRAAEVPMIVAINKIDKRDADPNRVRTDLLRHEVVVESMGGDTIEVEVSALEGTNLDRLLEMIALQAEVLELKANPDREADGVVVEAKLDKGRGPVATVLVQRGTLQVGDIVVVGAEWCKVRALVDDHGEQVDEAEPAMPVEILGLNGTPEAGDRFGVVDTEARARKITEYRQRMKRDMAMARASGGALTSLEQMMQQLSQDGVNEFPLVIKADVQGSAEAIAGALEKLNTDEVASRIVLSGVGGITESDVTLASASGAAIIGFNTRANKQARELADRDGLEIRYYNVIYDLVDDVKNAMSGMLAPEQRETMLGNAEILEMFNISKLGKVAGCRVTDGTVERGANVRLIRDDVVIHEGKLSQLKRFKDDANSVVAGQECGMSFESCRDMRAGDVIECFRVEEIERTL